MPLCGQAGWRPPPAPAAASHSQRTPASDLQLATHPGIKYHIYKIKVFISLLPGYNMNRIRYLIKHNIKEMTDWSISSADGLCNELRSKLCVRLLCIVGLDWVGDVPGQDVAQAPGQVPEVDVRVAACVGGLVIGTLEGEERKEESIRGGEDEQKRDEDLHIVLIFADVER